MTPYYEQDGIVIYHGDCREVLPTLAIESPVVVFDPPYGINHQSSHGASWQNTEIKNDSDTAVRDWVVRRFVGCPLAVFGTWKVSRPECRAVLIWDKGPAFGMGDLSFPWKPSFEEIYIIGDGWSGRRDEGVLRGPPVVSWESKGRRHPHEKPVWLMSHLISKTPCEVVIDPTCGTGPTLRAAKDLGRRAIGIEIEERYCEIAANRLRQGVLFGSDEHLTPAPEAAPNGPR